MDAIKEFIQNITEKANGFIQPVWDKIMGFLNSDMYVLYGAIAIVLAIIVLAGLIACFRKIPKLFITIIILLGIVVVIWYFFAYKVTA